MQVKYLKMIGATLMSDVSERLFILLFALILPIGLMMKSWGVSLALPQFINFVQVAVKNKTLDEVVLTVIPLAALSLAVAFTFTAQLGRAGVRIISRLFGILLLFPFLCLLGAIIVLCMNFSPIHHIAEQAIKPEIADEVVWWLYTALLLMIWFEFIIPIMKASVVEEELAAQLRTTRKRAPPNPPAGGQPH
jgi:hypothetical protein